MCNITIYKYMGYLKTAFNEYINARETEGAITRLDNPVTHVTLDAERRQIKNN